jgi:hypothetical protein
MLVKLREWIPDADDTEPGTLVDVNDMLPTLKGYKGAPTAANIGMAALAAECRGASMITNLSGTNVLFAGTQTKLYQAGSTTWTDVSRAGDYTGSSSSRWCFAQQGNVTLAVNKVDTSQYFLHGTSSDFADLTAMPICSVAEAVGQFVMVGNYTDVDGWACSKIGDYTNWTPSVDDQCVFGRLTDTPGAITALRRLGEYAIYYKRNSMYLARYVGIPLAWEFSLVSDIIGAVGNESVVKIGQVHYFLGDDDFYSFDSNTVQSIGNQIREWFNLNCNNLYRHKTIASHDRTEGVVYWFYPQGTSTTPSAWVAYHYRTNRWGKGTLSVEAACEFIAGGRGYDSYLTQYPNYNNYPTASYEAIFGISASTPLPAIIDTSHIVKTLTGATTTADLTTNDFGVDDKLSTIRRVRPRYVSSPDSASLTNYYRDNEGGDLTEDATTTESSGKFDVIRTARWHRGKISFTGDFELTALDIEAKGAGRE